MEGIGHQEEWYRPILTDLDVLRSLQPVDTPIPSEPQRYQQNASQSHNQNALSTFALFARLPIEIRNQIWKASLTPRIVKWIQKHDHDVFEVPSKSRALFSVNREAREAAFFYGEYILVSETPRTMYFSPIIDYLFFDPGWIDLVGLQADSRRPDPLDVFLPKLVDVRNIMVHPNYTEERKKPTVLFEKLPSLERVLVAADEKSIGFQSKYMISTVYDIDKYYTATARTRIPNIKKPYIAVGCLGWVGPERRSMHHGSEDHRQLVAVFENDKEIKAHAASLREEEWKFVQERFHHQRPKLKLKFRERRDDSTVQSSSSGLGATAGHLPSYLETAVDHGSEDAESSIPDENEDARAKRQRVEGEFNSLQATTLRSGDELPDYDQIV
jgi:hypothetical protein